MNPPDHVGPPPDHVAPSPEDPAKRKTLSRLTVAACAGLGCAVAAGPVGVALSPLFDEPAVSDTDGWSRLGAATRFVVDAPPTRIVLRADRKDSWVQQRGVAVGAVLVRRLAEDVRAPGAFAVFSSVCPHLGCAVRYQDTENRYHCPCHGSAFELDGSLVPEKSDGSANPSPRPLDRLAHDIDAAGNLRVRWARFRTGTSEQEELV